MIHESLHAYVRVSSQTPCLPGRQTLSPEIYSNTQCLICIPLDSEAVGRRVSSKSSLLFALTKHSHLNKITAAHSSGLALAQPFLFFLFVFSKRCDST